MKTDSALNLQHCNFRLAPYPIYNINPSAELLRSTNSGRGGRGRERKASSQLATRIKIQFHLVACEEGVGVCRLPRTSYVCLGEYVWGAMPG